MILLSIERLFSMGDIKTVINPLVKSVIDFTVESIYPDILYRYFCYSDGASAVFKLSPDYQYSTTVLNTVKISFVMKPGSYIDRVMGSTLQPSDIRLDTQNSNRVRLQYDGQILIFNNALDNLTVGTLYELTITFDPLTDRHECFINGVSKGSFIQAVTSLPIYNVVGAASINSNKYTGVLADPEFNNGATPLTLRMDLPAPYTVENSLELNGTLQYIGVLERDLYRMNLELNQWENKNPAPVNLPAIISL